MRIANRIIAGFICFVITINLISFSTVASAGVLDATMYGYETLFDWISGNSDEFLGGWNLIDWSSALFSSNKPQEYYTTPSESFEDNDGNVVNYYREGETVSTEIIDSYNHTFSPIHNTTNENDFEANIKLSEFLNTYATYTDNHTYNMDFKSWYYDATSNTYNYDASETYYNTDNSQYYISIDNSLDEYYLVDVHYSPTYVTVNYTYNTTNNNGNNYGNVTNVYYFELSDGRNSSTLTADEIAGLDLGYDVANYELVTDDPNTLSLQHFDGDYNDISSYGRTFYSVNRSTTYVDSGSFGKAVKLSSGAAAGVTIPGLSDYEGLTFDFRVYYDKISSLGIYLGNTNLMQQIPISASLTLRCSYADDFTDYELGRFCTTSHGSDGDSCGYPSILEQGFYDSDFNLVWPSDGGRYISSWSTELITDPTSIVPDAYSWNISYSDKYGWFPDKWNDYTLLSSYEVKKANEPWYDSSTLISFKDNFGSDHFSYVYTSWLEHYISGSYSRTPASSSVAPEPTKSPLTK